MQEYHYELWSDFFRFTMRDGWAREEDSPVWTEETRLFRVRHSPGVIEIATVSDEPVLVTVEIRDLPPVLENVEIWRDINECDLDLPSGQLVVLDLLQEKDRIAVTPSSYRVRVYCGDMNCLQDNEIEGGEQFRIVLWKAPPAPAVIIRSSQELE